jgi:hypothetical protein
MKVLNICNYPTEILRPYGLYLYNFVLAKKPFKFVHVPDLWYKIYTKPNTNNIPRCELKEPERPPGCLLPARLRCPGRPNVHCDRFGAKQSLCGIYINTVFRLYSL